MQNSESSSGSVSSSPLGDQLTSVASAAAMSAVVASELTKQGKLDEDDSSAEDQ
jgi:hypothetical protein